MKKKIFHKIKDIKTKKDIKGNLYKMISKKDNFYNKFGEIYFSEVCPNQFKGWKYHKHRSQIITVVSGKVRFFIKKRVEDKPYFIDISYPNKMKLLKIFPKTYYLFECRSKKKGLIINLIDEVVK